MKKLVSCIIVILLITQIPLFAFAQNINTNNTFKNIVLTKEESQTMSLIQKTLDKNKDDVDILRANGAYKDFLDEVSLQMDDYVSSNAHEILKEVAKWGISPEDSVSDIETKAQNYLNKHFNGLKIGSSDFESLVHKYLDNEDMGTRVLADHNLDFGPLYLYMCIYSTYVLENEETSIMNYQNYNDSSDISNFTMSDIAYVDSKEDFVDTASPQILNQYVQKYSTSSAWPKMNGEYIQNYARNYANKFNSNFITLDKDTDCTNFASQALFNGFLPMTYTNSDKNTNGIISTKTRWFHFKTSSTKYNISTSWIRVVELYDYLSPHYGVYETSKGSQMTPYLNKGFLLQGKPLIGKYKHSVIVVINNGAVQYCAHSSFRKDQPISTFYDGFSKYRVVQTY